MIARDPTEEVRCFAWYNVFVGGLVCLRFGVFQGLFVHRPGGLDGVR